MTTDKCQNLDTMLSSPYHYRTQLEELYERLRRILTPVCVRCGRPLIIPQHLDCVHGPDGPECIPCHGGS